MKQGTISLHSLMYSWAISWVVQWTKHTCELCQMLLVRLGIGWIFRPVPTQGGKQWMQRTTLDIFFLPLQRIDIFLPLSSKNRPQNRQRALLKASLCLDLSPSFFLLQTTVSCSQDNLECSRNSICAAVLWFVSRFDLGSWHIASVDAW